VTDSTTPSEVSSSSELRIFPDPTITRGLSAAQIHPLARFPEEWEEVLLSWGERPFRAKQIFRWIHGEGVLDPELMTNLSKGLRTKLAEGGLREPGSVGHVHRSSDGTRKLLLDLDRGAKVECVLIPMTPGSSMSESAQDAEGEDGDAQAEVPRKRITLCISTQFGCAMGCVFCASGQSGLFRGLGAAEVVYQVIRSKAYLEADEDLRNLVFMGMGEPLHHYEETARTLRLLTHPDGAGMSPRRITVSTVGLVPGIRRLGEDFAGKIGLAVSLHAPDDETRSRIMPMNKKYPIAELMEALREYPMPARRRMTIEYTLMGGMNDSIAQADQLAELLRPLRVKLNLIPMNPIEDSELKAPTDRGVSAFRERMSYHGYSCFVRTRRGDDVSAACGQLALQAIKPERLVRR
jgi:23S rRNA (adenine2503-C2)-methyltransferase